MVSKACILFSGFLGWKREVAAKDLLSIFDKCLIDSSQSNIVANGLL